MAVTISRTHYNALVDDDGSNLTGTPWVKARVGDILDDIDVALAAIAPASTAPTTTGTSTALAIPAGSGALTLVLNNATLLTVQGIAAGIDGQTLTVISKGAGQVDFAHLHASGTALGKLKLFATFGLTSLAAGFGVAVFQYDATVTQWRLVAHEQGAWINVAYNAGNFTASAGTWTVDVGDQTSFKYWLKGTTLYLDIAISTSSISATPSGIRITLPVGYSSGHYSIWTYVIGTATLSSGYYQIFANGTYIEFASNLAGAAWASSTNTTTIYLISSLEVR